jgi:hypothetical protein
MTDESKTTEAATPEAPKEYTQPRLTRWGTLRELTSGAGGHKSDPSGFGHPKSRA